MKDKRLISKLFKIILICKINFNVLTFYFEEHKKLVYALVSEAQHVIILRIIHKL